MPTQETPTPMRKPQTGWDALAADGSVVRIRPVRPEDEADLIALNHRVSDRSIYLRFFAFNRRGADQQTHHLVEVLEEHIALVAEADGRLIGVASFELLRPGEAEMAFLVDDAVHGRGIGTLLLEQLAAVAREHGIHHLHADTLAENVPMLRVFTNSGFEQVHKLDSGVVELSLSTAYSVRTLDRMAERERTAERRSLRPMFEPRSVAVIGAGRRPGGIGHEVLVNLIDGDFTGRLFAVNPQATQVGGVAAYPSIQEVPAPVDLAVIAVPSDRVAQVVEECGQAGVGGAVILTSGFGEAGADRRDTQQELVDRARRHGLRLIGPNCLGIVSTAPQIRLDATFANVSALPGSLALAAQSGAIGIAVLDHASRCGLGISEFASLGNKADVSGNDLLLHWWDDPRTEVVGLYLESLGNPRKFGQLARMVGRTKPVLVVKSGRSRGGRRAGASHTAAAATPETAVDALFEQAGVLRMETIEELIDTARVLTGPPLPKGRRLAVIGNAGGAGVLAADAAERYGIEVPEFSPATQQALIAATSAVAVGNPIDLGAAATPDTFEASMRAVLDSGEADAMLVAFAATRAGSVDDTFAAIARAATGATIPVLVTCLGAPEAEPRIALPDGSLPVFPFPETPVRALGHAIRYSEWRARPQGHVPELDGFDLEAAREIVRQSLEDNGDGSWLDAAAGTDLMRAIGVTVVPSVLASSRLEVLETAYELGYPVALKTAAPDIVHKTEVGGVRVGLAGEDELAEAYNEMVKATGDAHVSVQTMAPRGVELVAGFVRDPLFGPVLMAGSGGILTDLLADRRWRGLPLTDLDAAEMLRSLRSAPLLAGYRGAEPSDEQAVLAVLHRIAHLAESVPEITEMDINPLIAAPSGAFAVDVKLRVTTATPEPDWYSRRLR